MCTKFNLKFQVSFPMFLGDVFNYIERIKKEYPDAEINVDILFK